MPRYASGRQILTKSLSESDRKFSKFNRPFVIPSMASGPTLILPPSQMHNILNKPESEVDALGAQNDSIQASYTIKDSDIYMNNLQFNIVRKHLTRNIALFSQDVAEELALAFEQYWGTSGEWTSVTVWDSCLKIVARAANRVFVSIPLYIHVNLVNLPSD